MCAYELFAGMRSTPALAIPRACDSPAMAVRNRTSSPEAEEAKIEFSSNQA